jgi:signal transduction histidine kinase
VKSKYFLTLFLIGILPLLVPAGVYYWMAYNEAPAPPLANLVNNNALQTTIPMLQSQLSTMASTLNAAIVGTYQKVSDLVANHSDTDLDSFVKSHPGLEGVAVFTMGGKLQKTIPATAQLADPGYGSSDEFQKMISKFKENGGKTDLFFTQRLSYPAFIFSIPLDSKTLVEAVLNLSYFFRAIDPKSGEIFLLDADSGQYFYHSNPAKLQTAFNPNQEAWLNKVQDALKGKQSGSELNPPVSAAIYSYLGLKAFGIVHVVPFSVLQPPSPVSVPSAHTGLQRIQEIVMDETGRWIGIAVLGSLGWVLFVGSLCLVMILGPLRRASTLVLNAAQGKAELTAQSVKAFGNDEVGHMVQASSLLLQKLEQDRQEAAQEKEEALRRGRMEVEAKSKEAANQVAAAQQAAASAKNEANDKNQLLNDKLKELDALKGMSEGLRGQTEQAKAEIGKLKSQVATTEQAKAETQQRLTQTQAQLETQLKEMEAKLLSAVAASSAIQVSQVRAAAIRTMSEELKTTLGIIKGYVSSALGSTQGGINEKQQEFLGMVINRSARLEKFINDLVDIYQVEIEQAGAQYEEINLASEIEGLAFNFQAQAEVKNIKMKVEAKGAVPKVPVVRRRFNQLWNILYLQIIKDAPRGSSIPITVEPLGETVKVTVQDPGLVVVPESLPRLFDEFYDPKHPASTQLAGTGLKFALLKTILAAHGGGAVAEKGDPGTRLILTFPTKIKKPGEAPIPAAANAQKPALSVGASPAIPPAPPAAPGIGLPKPAAPLGVPKPLTPVAPVAGAPAAKPATTPGLLDSLIAKVPPVTAPGLRPTPGAVPPPAAGVPPLPPKPPIPPGVPASPSTLAPPAPGLKPPSSTSSLLDSLMDKKPVPPPGAPAVPTGAGPSIPAAPPLGAPRPSISPVPGVPSAPKPLVPPSPGLPSVAPAAAPPMAPRPAAPPMPGIPGMAAPAAPRPPIPGAPSMAPSPAAPSIPPVPGIGAGAPAAPKVIPTNLKPTAPPPGIIDLDSMDGMKLDVGAPKAPVPGMPPLGAPKPPLPGSPMPPPGMPKPPAPGVPPGGLDASKAQKSKDGEGELIE